MSPPLSALSLCVCLALLAGPALAEAPASGSFRLEATDYTVTDAIAFPHHDDIRVVLSDRALDRAQLGEDGTIDNLDFFDVPGVVLELSIDPVNGELQMLSSRSDGKMGMLFASSARLELSHNDAERIAGRVQVGDGPQAHFDLAITRTIERPGQALPADGGEPGQVLLAHVQAITSGDLDALIAQAPAEKAERFRQARASGEADKMLAMARVFTPSAIAISGGHQDGDRAWIDFTGKADGRDVTGVGRLHHRDGRWQVEGIDTR